MSKLNLYKILGVNHNASEKDIRKAYITLALKYHPDKNEQLGAREKFQEILNAYETLSDPQRRRTYDETTVAARLRKHPARYTSDSSSDEGDSPLFTCPYDMGGGIADIPWVFLWDQEHFWDGSSSIFDSLNFFLEGIHGLLGRIRDPLFRNMGMIHDMMTSQIASTMYAPHVRYSTRARSTPHSRDHPYCHGHRHFVHAHAPVDQSHRQKSVRRIGPRHSANTTASKTPHKRRKTSAREPF